jgi:hypothetical protein
MISKEIEALSLFLPPLLPPLPTLLPALFPALLPTLLLFLPSLPVHSTAITAPDLVLAQETGFQVSSSIADFCQCPLGGPGGCLPRERVALRTPLVALRFYGRPLLHARAV